MRTSLLITLIALMVVPTGRAQTTGELPPVFDGVGIDAHRGREIPRDLVFLDEAGTEVLIGSYFDGTRPVLLNFVYHECPMLCSLMLAEFTKTLAELEEEEGWIPGREFEVVTVSFSATELPDLASRSKDKYIAQLGLEDAAEGWHFLTGSDDSIQGLADAFGFGFKWVEQSQEFAHPAALMFLSGSAVITQYIQGMTFPVRDVRLAIVEASEGRVGSTADKIFLFCYRYDSQANSYVADAWNMMRAAGLMTVVLLAGFLFAFWRRERRKLTFVST